MGSKRLVALAAAVATVLPLAGCSPPALPVAVVRYADGRPVLLIAPCAELVPQYISVWRDAAVGARWEIRWQSGPPPEQVNLLEVPQGWALKDQPNVHALTEFAGATRYSVGVWDSPRQAQGVTFTLERLAELPAGDVLVGGGGREMPAVSERTFRSRARDACD